MKERNSGHVLRLDKFTNMNLNKIVVNCCHLQDYAFAKIISRKKDIMNSKISFDCITFNNKITIKT